MTTCVLISGISGQSSSFALSFKGGPTASLDVNMLLLIKANDIPYEFFRITLP